MKFIISENKLSSSLEKALNNKIKNDEFHWVDKIEVIIDSTESSGWSIDAPLFVFKIHLKDDSKINYKSQSNLFDIISTFFKMVRPKNIEVYFTTISVLPNGKTGSFPL